MSKEILLNDLLNLSEAEMKKQKLNSIARMAVLIRSMNT